MPRCGWLGQLPGKTQAVEEFVSEVQARLGSLLGDEMKVGKAPPLDATDAWLWKEVFRRLDQIESNQERLEKALKAHGVGAWAGLA